MMCYNNTNSSNVDQYVTTTNQFYNCSNSLVYERDDIILRSVYFTFKTASFNETEVNWEDFTETLIHGKCQTLRNLPELEEAYNFKAILNESIAAPYKIWLHDPDYFVTSLKVRAITLIPRKTRKYEYDIKSLHINVINRKFNH